jgi:biopolymer transport protein ExbD
MRRVRVDPNEGTLGFQIAPMIDVVFVIMLFFMVMAGEVKVEKELNCTLPGTVDTAKEAAFVEEQVIQITTTGEVLYNEEPIGKADDRILEALRATLRRQKQLCDAAKTPCQVTIASEAKSKHGRTMEVADACAEAGITSLSFNVTEEE